MRQITEIKNLLVKKIETKYKDLANEVSKSVREKRKAIEGRKTVLDRFHVQVSR